MSQTLKVCAVICGLLFCLTQSTTARPKERRPPNGIQEQWVECNAKVIDTCQKCAKATKSNIVYPLCCNQEDGAFAWCEEYLYYGIQF